MPFASSWSGGPLGGAPGADHAHAAPVAEHVPDNEGQQREDRPLRAYVFSNSKLEQILF